MSIDLLALLSIVALSVSLVATLTGYLRLQNKLHQVEEEEERLKTAARHKAGKIIEQAQDAAFQIANAAVVRAEENSHLVKSRLEEISNQQIEEYQKLVRTAATSVEHEVVKMVGLKMDEEWAQVKAEIAAYKAQKITQIDGQAQTVVQDMAKKVLGKTIDTATHTELILEALTAAKNDHGF